MATMTDADVDEFLRAPRDAVLSVVLGSGRAMGTPIWFRWSAGVIRFQSPTTSAKTAALRATGRASLCVHEQVGVRARYVTVEGVVTEVPFDLVADIEIAARHYLGEQAAAFMAGIDQALAEGRRWASFELTPTSMISNIQQMV